jgi:DNA mismatch endonuclease (patch repair protein)
MRAVKGKNTSLETTVSSAFHHQGWRFRRHVAALPGKPDFVFVRARVVVFVDGDFWHGWQFPRWKDALAPYWRQKIEKNRIRDRKHFRRLRRMGWTVLRIWGHEVERDLEFAVARVGKLLKSGLRRAKPS